MTHHGTILHAQWRRITAACQYYSCCTTAVRTGDIAHTHTRSCNEWIPGGVKMDAANGANWDEGVCIGAAKNGHLDVLKWLHAHGAPWCENVCAAAAKSGNLNVLKWLHANGAPLGRMSGAKAAANGHIGVLKWLRANGAPWCEYACAAEAKHGRLDILISLRIM